MRTLSPCISLMAVAFLIARADRAEAQVIRCEVLRTSDSAYAGRCSQNDTTVSMLVLRPPQDPRHGRWLGTQARIFGEGADTADIVDWTAFAPTFVDVGTGQGIFNWCWCRVTKAIVDTRGLHFEADPDQRVGTSDEDVRILELTRSFFTDSTTWDRDDPRNRAITYCPANPKARTLFCALYAATVRVRGDNYWGPAGAALQQALRAATSRRYRHPITEFNNDSAIGFDTFTDMLDDAVRRAREATRAADRGGV